MHTYIICSCRENVIGLILEKLSGKNLLNWVAMTPGLSGLLLFYHGQNFHQELFYFISQGTKSCIASKL